MAAACRFDHRPRFMANRVRHLRPISISARLPLFALAVALVAPCRLHDGANPVSAYPALDHQESIGQRLDNGSMLYDGRQAGLHCWPHGGQAWHRPVCRLGAFRLRSSPWSMPYRPGAWAGVPRSCPASGWQRIRLGWTQGHAMLEWLDERAWIGFRPTVTGKDRLGFDMSKTALRHGDAETPTMGTCCPANSPWPRVWFTGRLALAFISCVAGPAARSGRVAAGPARGKNCYAFKSRHLALEISTLRPQLLSLSVDSLGRGQFAPSALRAPRPGAAHRLHAPRLRYDT